MTAAIDEQNNEVLPWFLGSKKFDNNSRVNNKFWNFLNKTSFLNTILTPLQWIHLGVLALFINIRLSLVLLAATNNPITDIYSSIKLSNHL